MAEVLGQGMRVTSRGDLLRVLRPLPEHPPWYLHKLGRLSVRLWVAWVLVPVVAVISAFQPSVLAVVAIGLTVLLLVTVSILEFRDGR